MTNVWCEVCGGIVAQVEESPSRVRFVLHDQIDLNRATAVASRCSQHALPDQVADVTEVTLLKSRQA